MQKKTQTQETNSFRAANFPPKARKLFQESVFPILNEVGDVVVVLVRIQTQIEMIGFVHHDHSDLGILRCDDVIKGKAAGQRNRVFIMAPDEQNRNAQSVGFVLDAGQYAPLPIVKR